MKILGVDPGQTTGLALIELDQNTKKLSLLGIRESTDQTCLDWQDWMTEADVVVYETFRVRPGVNFVGDDMVASRVIGALTALARQQDKTLVPQEPAIKPVGYGWSNQTYKRGKQGMHQQDGIAHAVFYAVKKHSARPLTPG